MGADIHPAAREGFSREAGAYERSRPGYPPSALAWLVRRLGLAPGVTVLDLAAGTGKLSRELAATGADVIAVEPVAAMRAALERLVPAARALDGTAEAIPLPDGVAAAVTVAQAFHWFDGDRALAELHRVLAPGGALALVWNRRDLSDPTQEALRAVLDRRRGETPAHRTDAWRAAFERTPHFGPLEEVSFPNVQWLDAEGLVARALSTSFIGALDADGRREVVAEVLAIAERLPERFPLPHATEIQVAARRG